MDQADHARGGALTLALDIVVGAAILGGLYALCALGLNLQYGLMRVLNVGHGEFLMLGAYATYTLHTRLGIDPLVTLLVTAPLFFLLGLALHRLLFAKLMKAQDAGDALESRSLLLSFGILFVVQNVALLVWTSDPRGYTYLAEPVHIGGAVFPANRMVAAGIALALSFGFYAFLRRSLFGKALRALMQDPAGARLQGIDVRRAHGVAFGLGVAMSAVAGSLTSMLFELSPFMGLPYTITALTIVIVGGLGNMLGSVLAALLLGLVETLGAYLVSADIRLVSSYGVLVLVLVLRPAGLFGARRRAA